MTYLSSSFIMPKPGPSSREDAARTGEEDERQVSSEQQGGRQ